MKYKAIIIDIDGTAIDSPTQKLASGRLKAATEKLQQLGIEVCAATGRSRPWAKDVLHSLGLHGPAIVSGGTKIIDPNSDKDLWRCDIEPAQVTSLIKALQTSPYNRAIWNDYTEDEYMEGGKNISELEAEQSVHIIEVPFVPTGETDDFLGLITGIQGIAVVDMFSFKPGTTDFHISNAIATKEHAVYELENIIGVSKEHMIAIGDGGNDMPLFNAAGYNVAMGNATTKLKDAADEIIGEVKDDGLAVYFENLAKELESEV